MVVVLAPSTEPLPSTAREVLMFLLMVFFFFVVCVSVAWTFHRTVRLSEHPRGQ